MKLTGKLVITFLIVIAAIAGIEVYLDINREVARFAEVAMHGAVSVGTVLEPIIVRTWPDHGVAAAEEHLELINAAHPHMSVRWVFLQSTVAVKHQPAIAVADLELVSAPHEIRLQRIDSDQNGYLEMYWPVPVADQSGALEIGYSTLDLEQTKQSLIRDAVMRSGAILTLVALSFAALGVRMLGRPLKALIAKTRRAADGDLSGSVELRARDELTELAQSLNDMCAKLSNSQAQAAAEAKARLNALEQLRHADRLQTVGRLAAGVAHELGTPLAVVSGRGSLIASGKLSADEIQNSAVAIRTEADRMTTIIKQLLSFARRDPLRRQAVDLGELLINTLKMMESLARDRGVELAEPARSEPRTAWVDPFQFQQVAANLIQNAIQSMPGSGRVEVTLDDVQVSSPPKNGCPPGAYYRIQFIDQGTGIADEHRDRVFEPFFTTKEVGKGTGLGLSVALGIVQDHGGWIDFTSTPSVGSCFRVYLPKERPE
jgi:signal transduction histidine kinase